MTTLTYASANGADAIDSAQYRPGICNIGPREIRRRRRTGHIGLAVAVALLAVLLAVDAPPVARLLIGLPAMISASGYLQAWLKFCAGFASIGIYNFGEADDSVKVVDEAARAADRRRGLQISIASFAIGAAVGMLVALLPI